MKFPKKKPGHYETKKKKSDREVLSFEQLPLEEYEKEPEGIKRKLDVKRILIAIGIVVMVALCVLLYFNRGALISCSGMFSAGNDFTASVSGLQVEAGNFENFSDGVAYLSDTGFYQLSAKGEKTFSAQLNFTSPSMSVCSDKAIAYDLGSTGFAIFTDEKLVLKSTAEDNVYLADITSDGSYALITDVNGYNAKLYVYNSDNTVKYAYSFADYYITSFALNKNATEAVVCGITAENGAEKSAVYVLDFTQEEPRALHVLYDDLIFDCDYLSQSSVCAVGSKGVYVAKGKDFSEFVTSSFDGMTLTAYDINTDLNSITLSLSRSGDGRNCTLQAVNTKGEAETVVDTKLKITALSTYKDRVAVASSDVVYLYKTSGDLEASKELGTDLAQIRLFSTHSLYVLGIDTILSVSI